MKFQQSQYVFFKQRETNNSHNTSQDKLVVEEICSRLPQLGVMPIPVANTNIQTSKKTTRINPAGHKYCYFSRKSVVMPFPLSNLKKPTAVTVPEPDTGPKVLAG